MSKVCQITGKRAMNGNNVSHSKRRTKKSFDVNLFEKLFYWPEQDTWVALKVSAKGLRTINKKGVNAVIIDALNKGLMTEAMLEKAERKGLEKKGLIRYIDEYQPIVAD